MKLFREVDKRLVNRINRCIQCGSCSSVCPAARIGVFNPRKMIYDIKMHREIKQDLWKCVTCSLCVAVCPNSVEPLFVVETLRRELEVPENLIEIIEYYMSRGVSLPPVKLSNYNLSSSRRDLIEGLKIILERIDRRISISVETFSDAIRACVSEGFHRLSRALEINRVVVYPGCIALNVYPSIIDGCIDVLQRLDCEPHVIINDFMCCGYPIVASGRASVEVFIYTSGVVDAIARELNAPVVVTPCNGCLHSLVLGYAYSKAMKNIAEEVKKIVSSVIGVEPEWKTPVLSISDLLAVKANELNVEIKDRIAPFYGCHYTSIQTLLQREPRALHIVLKNVSSKVIDHAKWYGCCGGFTPTDIGMVKDFSGRILVEANIRGAEYIVTQCNGCLANLDRAATYMVMESKKIAKPIHITQLLMYAYTGSEKAFRDLTYTSMF